MRTIILTLFSLGIFLFANVQPVGAYACAGWNCYNYGCDGDGCQSTCEGTPAGCSDNPTCQQTGDCEGQVQCGSGYYACNNGCCPVGNNNNCPCGLNTAGFVLLTIFI